MREAHSGRWVRLGVGLARRRRSFEAVDAQDLLSEAAWVVALFGASVKAHRQKVFEYICVCFRAIGVGGEISRHQRNASDYRCLGLSNAETSSARGIADL